MRVRFSSVAPYLLSVKNSTTLYESVRTGLNPVGDANSTPEAQLDEQMVSTHKVARSNRVWGVAIQFNNQRRRYIWYILEKSSFSMASYVMQL